MKENPRDVRKMMKIIALSGILAVACIAAILFSTLPNYEEIGDASAYERYMSNVKELTPDEFLQQCPSMSMPKWLPSGLSLTTIYDGASDIIVYSNNGNKDFRTANVVIELVPYNGGFSTEGLTNSSNLILIDVKDVPVIIVPNAVGGYIETSKIYPDFPYCCFVWNDLYIQLSARGCSVEELISMVQSIAQ